jgi:multisubunit Na+/H+ antiporter MnhB subunit
MGRPDDAMTTGITIAVIMVVAAVSPQDSWRQPVLRLVDTAVGVAVGIAAAWLGTGATRVTKLFGRGKSLGAGAGEGA